MLECPAIGIALVLAKPRFDLSGQCLPIDFSFLGAFAVSGTLLPALRRISIGRNSGSSVGPAKTILRSSWMAFCNSRTLPGQDSVPATPACPAKWNEREYPFLYQIGREKGDSAANSGMSLTRSPQRRQMGWLCCGRGNTDPSSKTTLFDERFQILVRGGDDPHVRRKSFVAANSLKAPLLQQP